MVKVKKELVIILIVGFILVGTFIFIHAQNNMTIEATFKGYGERIAIDVPDEYSYVNFGEISPSHPWNQTNKIYLNNTGTKDALVTIETDEDYSEVFDYLYIRKSTPATHYRFQDFNVTIPNGETRIVYVGINMTDFNGTLESGEVNYNITLQFVGMAA